MRWFAAAVVLLVIFVPARSASPAAGAPPCTATGSDAPADRPARARDLKLRVAAEWSAKPNDDQVTWILKLQNRTNQALRLTFASSMYGNVVLRRSRRTVYRWDSGKGFYQAVWYSTVAPRETFACSLSRDVLDLERLGSGRYQLLAYLNLYPFDVRVEARRSVSIDVG